MFTPPYIEETYKMVRKHKWYMDARLGHCERFVRVRSERRGFH